MEQSSVSSTSFGNLRKKHSEGSQVKKHLLTKQDAQNRVNKLAQQGQCFFLLSDFDQNQNLVFTHEEIQDLPISIQFPGFGTQVSNEHKVKKFEKTPVSYEDFLKSFEQVKAEINLGNSFLTNLTFESPIQTNLLLDQLYDVAQAKYKLLFDDDFVVFSPETFVKTIDNKIFSYPMKGTIDASLPEAKDQILGDEKEMAEHATIVDLIRNDLSRYASDVKVNKFRFIDTIQTNQKTLLQVSSEIEGKLPPDYPRYLGDIIFSMLPAGSISGAPKPETLSIIKNSEQHERGFYTGICGYFDGKNFDSFVMIRYIEQRKGRLFFKSGGGITHLSDGASEYQEMIDKVYVPIY